MKSGGMYRAVETGLVQKMIGASALRFQNRIDSGEQVVVGVNAYQVEEDAATAPWVERPDARSMQQHIEAFAAWKRARSTRELSRADATLQRACEDTTVNLFGAVVDAARAGMTHGEICERLRATLGFGRPLAIV
jgi:methylmalonyl-CoA mutase, N-terminal domain